MRNIATLALVGCLAAAPAAARDGGLRLLSPDWLEVTPGIQHDAQDDSAYAAETGFLTQRSLESAQWTDTLVLQSLSAFEAEIVSGSGFAAGITAGSTPRRSLLDNPNLGPARPDAGVGAYGSFSVDDVTLTARLGQESADGIGGFVADLGLKWASQIMEGLTFTVGSEISWADQDYMNNFFGAGARQPFSSGLRLYDAEPGLKDVTVSGSVTYSVGDNRTVGGLVGAQRFLGSAASSPVTRDENEYFGGVSLGVRF